MVLSKITNILLALLCPNKILIKELEHFVADFCRWNKETPRFRKEIIEAEIKEGGLKMHNLLHFSQTLKISWVRKLTSCKGNWTSIPKFLGIDTCFFLGDSYAKSLLGQIGKMFWISFIESVLYTMVNIQPKNTDDLQGIPIWYNCKLGNKILPKWMRNGVYILSDLLSANAKILSQSETKLQYGLKTNFLEYGNVKHHIYIYI